MTAQLLHLIAPDLKTAPVVGMGCCGAVAPDDLARDELDSWPGMHVESLDVSSGTIVVALSEDAPPVDDLLDALHDRGVAAHLEQDSLA
jgi:predicted naringenin-chalcone synthase